MSTPNDLTPLGDAKAWLRARVADGERCPCCTQMAKIYPRQVNSGMARSLIIMWRYTETTGEDWVYVPRVVGSRSREEGKLAYWGLIEEATEKREDGGRAGWWRLTDRGIDFVLGRITITKYARIYADRVLGFDGPQVTIWDCLKKKFDYNELMQYTP